MLPEKLLFFAATASSPAQLAIVAAAHRLLTQRPESPTEIVSKTELPFAPYEERKQ